MQSQINSINAKLSEKIVNVVDQINILNGKWNSFSNSTEEFKQCSLMVNSLTRITSDLMKKNEFLEERISILETIMISKQPKEQSKSVIETLKEETKETYEKTKAEPIIEPIQQEYKEAVLTNILFDTIT